MAAQLTKEQLAWAAQFCGLPAITTTQAQPMPATHAPAKLKPTEAAPASEKLPAINPEGAIYIDAARIDAFDAAVPDAMDLIAHARKAAADLTYVADQHGIDAHKPAEAVAVLAKSAAPLIDAATRHGVEDAYHIVELSQQQLSDLLLQIEDKTQDLQIELDALAKKAAEERADAEAAAKQQAEIDYHRGFLAYLYDFIVEAVKAVEDVATAAKQSLNTFFIASLELLELDKLKDMIKGEDANNEIDKLKQRVDHLEEMVETFLQRELMKTEGILAGLVKRTKAAYDVFVDDVGTYNERMQQAIARLPKTASGNPASPEVLGLMLVHQAVVERGRAFQAALAGITASKSLRDLAFWKSAVVPLGTLQFSGRDPPDDPVQKLVYARGGKSIIIELPGHTLRNTMEALSAAVTAIGGFDKAEAEAASTLADQWMRAVVKAL